MPAAADPYDLQRFVDAQAGIHEQALSELRQGRKRSHWMWFVFPQFAGLGRSAMAEEFAISSVAEADAYLKHPVLGPRLVACTEAVLAVQGRTAAEIFGYPDDLKFRSSMTLFARAAPDATVFRDALARYFGGEPDTLTTQKL